MKKQEREILTEFLGKTLNMPADAVAPLFVENGEEHELKPEAVTVLLQKDAERVKSFKDKIEDERTKAYSKAKAETLGKFEQEVKSKFGKDSDKTGLELVEEIISDASAAGKTIDAEKLKTHPEFLKLEKEWNKSKEAAISAVQKQFDDFKTEKAQEQIFSKVANNADIFLQELKPILSKDPAKAANQKRLLLDELRAFNYQENENDFVILNKEGKRHEDQHGKPITLKTLVQETAGKYWDFETGESRSGSGAGQQQPAGKKGDDGKVKWEGKVPKNDQEFSAEFAKTTDAMQRVALSEAYQASKQKA